MAASATVVAIFTAIGVTQWRSEMKGRARFEIAREIVGLINQFCDQYTRTRQAPIFFQEYSSRDKREEEGQEEARYRDELYARDRRVQILYETLIKLRKTSWQAEIVFTKEFGEHLEPFRRAYKDLRKAVDVYCSTYLERAMEGALPDITEIRLLEEHRRVIYGDEEDEYSQRIANAVDEFVAYLKKEL